MGTSGDWYGRAVTATAEAPLERTDPFELPPPAEAPTRPRLLSHVGRWGRARRWLPEDGLRLLDVGSSWGYGSVAIGAGGPAGRAIVGVEQDPGHLARARENFPWLRVVEGDATELSVADGCADVVIMLDVLEHCGDPRPVIDEAHRALRPGGTLIVSVPNKCPQRGIDSLNVYRRLRLRRPAWPPLEPATESADGVHRHYSTKEMRDLLAPRFSVDRVARSGLGLQEPVHLAGMIARVPRHAETVGQVALITHLLVYILDDLIPAGPLGYHLTLRARKVA